MKKLLFIFSLFFFSIVSATSAESLSKEDALIFSFQSAGLSTENIFHTAKEKNIISQNFENKKTESIVFIEFLKISLKSHGFVDQNNCALRGNEWYTPFLDIALSHNILSEIPNSGKLNSAISLTQAEEILQNITNNKNALNSCPQRKRVLAQSVNFRMDAGVYGNNIFEKIPTGSEVIKIGEPITGKSIFYSGRNQDQWQAIFYNGNIGFVLPEFLSEDKIHGKFFEKLQRDFSLFELEEKYTNPCNNIFVQPLQRYKVKGESTEHIGGILVYQSGKQVQFIRSELAHFYQENGGACGNIGIPLAPASRFGNSPDHLQQPFLSQYSNHTQWRNGFEESRIGWSQAFSSGKTLYTPNKSEDVFFLVTKRANCVFDLSQYQVCCESPRGKMCHDAVSGGGNRFNNHIRTNNSDWQWHHTLLANTWDIAGPIPLGEYNMQYAGGACKYRSPFLHFTCISYLLHKGSSSRIHPPAGTKKPNGEGADFREELFFHPAFSSAGCITFTDHLENWDNASNWEKEIPKWAVVRNILDGGPIYGSGYMGGGFIGKMIVTE